MRMLYVIARIIYENKKDRYYVNFIQYLEYIKKLMIFYETILKISCLCLLY